MAILKILRKSEWSDFQSAGETTGAPVDLADGFIHFSTAEQVHETVARHFSGETDLIVLEVDETTLGGDLKWEASRGGALFPHLYRPLRIDDITRHATWDNWVQDNPAP